MGKDKVFARINRWWKEEKCVMIRKKGERKMTLNSYMPVKLITGAGCVRQNAKALGQLGKTCLIVTGKHSAKA